MENLFQLFIVDSGGFWIHIDRHPSITSEAEVCIEIFKIEVWMSDMLISITILAIIYEQLRNNCALWIFFFFDYLDSLIRETFQMSNLAHMNMFRYVTLIRKKNHL